MSFIFRLSKETFKFSCTHFTIFGPNHAERMHGHNYYVGFDLHFNSINEDEGLAVDFNVVKPIMKEICNELDEHVLIAKNSPHQSIIVESSQVNIKFNNKNYSLPEEDTLILPLANISSEELSRYIAFEFIRKAPSNIGLYRVETTIEETRGQGVTFVKDL